MFLHFISIFFFIIPVVKENKRPKIALAIPTGLSIILTKETIDIPPLIADKAIKVLSK